MIRGDTVNECERISISESNDNAELSKQTSQESDASLLSGLKSRLKHQQIVEIIENEPLYNPLKIEPISKILLFVMKTLLSYAMMMFLCLTFVFTVNIIIEILLFVCDALMTCETMMGKIQNAFVYIPQFIIILRLCWTFTHQCWKSSILIWSLKYDRYYVHFCNLFSVSIGTLFRCFVLFIIIILTIWQTLKEIHSIRIIEMDDLAMGRHLTIISMCVGGVLSVMFVVLSFLWRIWIIFICIDMKSLFNFFMLMYKIDLNVWWKANETIGLNNSICNEMKQRYKQNQRHQALRKTFDDFDLLQNETEIKFIRNSTISKSHQNNGCRCTTKIIFTSIMRLVAIIWYIAQIRIVYTQKRGSKFLFSCTLLPLLLYFVLLTFQCEVKLFQYLSGMTTAKGPSVMKILLSIWCIMGLSFIGTFMFFEYMDITELRSHAMEASQYLGNPHAEMPRARRLPHSVRRRRALPFMKYPLCHIKEEQNVLLDSVFFSKLAYEHNTTVMEQAIDIYLRGQNRQNPWKIYNAGYFMSGQSPVFFHLIDNTTDNTTTRHMIINRGTAITRDVYEDFTLYSEILALTGFSKIFPIMELWPDSLTRSFIKKLSVTEAIIFEDIENHHHKGVIKYIEEVIIGGIHSGRHNDVELTIAGHSLGGAVSHIAGALLKEKYNQLQIRSIGISPPGVYYSSDKFGIDIKMLSRIATTIIPDLDPVPRIDLHTGQVHHIQCQAGVQRKCHSAKQTLFELYDACVAERAPQLQSFMECLKEESLDVCVRLALSQ